MDYSRYHSLSCERQDTVLIVALNRPEAVTCVINGVQALFW